MTDVGAFARVDGESAGEKDHPARAGIRVLCTSRHHRARTGAMRQKQELEERHENVVPLGVVDHAAPPPPMSWSHPCTASRRCPRQGSCARTRPRPRVAVPSSQPSGFPVGKVVNNADSGFLRACASIHAIAVDDCIKPQEDDKPNRFASSRRAFPLCQLPAPHGPTSLRWEGKKRVGDESVEADEIAESPAHTYPFRRPGKSAGTTGAKNGHAHLPPLLFAPRRKDHARVRGRIATGYIRPHSGSFVRSFVLAAGVPQAA